MQKVYEDEKGYNLLKTVSKYGVILWLGLFVLNVIMLVTGLHQNDNQLIITVLSLLFQIAIVSAAIKIAKSDNYARKALVGILTSFLAGIISIASLFATTTLIRPNYYEEIRERAELLFVEQGLEDDQIEELIQAYEEPVVRYTHPTTVFVKTLFSGVIISLIVAVFIKESEEK